MRNLFEFLFLLLLPLASLAGPIEDALAEFRKHKLVEIDLLKKAKNDLDGSTTMVNGKGYFSGLKFRIDLEPPEKSKVIYDGTVLWVVQYPPEASGKTGTPVQVFKRSGKKVSLEQKFISTLLGKGQVPKELKFEKESNQKFWAATPKPGQLGSVKKLKLEIENQQLKALVLIDDLDNQVTYELLKIKGKNRGQAGLFQYQPEKGAIVNNEK